MRLLVDENLPPRLAALLNQAGHDAVHIRDLKLTSSPDTAILDAATTDHRTIVSADTDFGALLAHRRVSQPSVLLVREIVALPPSDLARTIADQLDDLQPHLERGAIVAFARNGVRIRALPLR